VPCSLVMVSPGGEAGVGVLPGASRCPCMHGFIWTIERGTKVPSKVDNNKSRYVILAEHLLIILSNEGRYRYI